MPVQPKNLGDFKLDLGGTDIEKHLSSIHLTQELDNFATLTVAVARTQAQMSTMSTLKPPDFPTETTLTWAGRTIFRGHILSADVTGGSRCDLTYVDSLYLTSKQHLNRFIKDQSLRECLRSLAETSGLKVDFRGSFNETVSGLSHGTLSCLEIMGNLADKYGFHFVTHATSQAVVFIKPPEGISRVQLDASQKATSLTSRLSSAGTYDKVRYQYFDLENAQAKENTLHASQLYRGTGNQQKSRWRTAAGTVEVPLTDRRHFQTGQDVLAGHFTKKAQGQEAVQVACFEPLAMVGDSVQLTKTVTPGIHDGAYLAAASDIRITSAVPKMVLQLVRP